MAKIDSWSREAVAMAGENGHGDANRGAAVSKLHEQSLAPVTEWELSVVRFQ